MRGRALPQAAADSKGIFAAMAAAAGLPKVERDLASAAPWLLPPRTSSLPYSGLEGDLDRLLEVQGRLRTGPGGTAFKTITAMVFSRRMAPLLQNTGKPAATAVTWSPWTSGRRAHPHPAVCLMPQCTP